MEIRVLGPLAICHAARRIDPGSERDRAAVGARITSVPRQLPPGVNDRVGLAGLVEAIVRVLTTASAAVAVVAVTPMGGIGKTT